jgi:hypothetical protein
MNVHIVLPERRSRVREEHTQATRLVWMPEDPRNERLPISTSGKRTNGMPKDSTTWLRISALVASTPSGAGHPPAQCDPCPRWPVEVCSSTGRCHAQCPVRALVLAELRAELAPQVRHARLEAALSDAMLLDEEALLPPRQRFALRSTAIDRATVADVLARTGWTAPQVARLLRAALRTVTSHSRRPSL